MTQYFVTNGKTFFSEDFSHIYSSFSLKTDTPDENGKSQFNGMFVGDIDWEGYFTDPILCRFHNLEAGSHWLGAYVEDNRPNDIFFNKLVEYINLSRSSNGDIALVVSDDAASTLSIDDDDDYFTDKEELIIFDKMFNEVSFLEKFKDELDDPSKYNLTSALHFFKTIGAFTDEPAEVVESIQDKFIKYLL